MMVLTLLTKQIDGEFTVYWKTGLRRGGELKVLSLIHISEPTRPY